MFNKSRVEAYDWENAATGKTKRRTIPKLAALSVFGPRLETRNVPIEAREPAIRTQTRPEGIQERRDARIAFEKAQREAAIRREKARLEEIKLAEAMYARQREILLDIAEREDKQMKARVEAVLATFTVVGILAATGAIMLGFQAFLSSLSSLSSLEGLAAAAPGVVFNALRDVIGILALGDPTLTAVAVSLSLTLIVAVRNSIVSGEKVRKHRREFGY